MFNIFYWASVVIFYFFFKLNFFLGLIKKINQDTLMKKRIETINIITDPNLNTANIPLIFKKKQKRSLIKSLDYVQNDVGQTRHYPPAAQEWYNSIYTYNQNYIKSLPALDKSLSILLKSYSNMIPGRFSTRKVKLFLKAKKLKGKQKRLLIRKLKVKSIIKHKRLTPRQVFVGKGSLKHTSDKVTITLYTYSLLKRFLLRKIKRLIHFLYFPQKTLVLYITKDLLDPQGRKLISYNRPLSLQEFLYSPADHKILTEHVKIKVPRKGKPTRKSMRKAKAKASRPTRYNDASKMASYWITFYEAYLSFTISNIKKVTRRLNIIIDYYAFLTKLVQDKVLFDKQKLVIFMPIVAKFKSSEYSKRFFFSVHKAKKLYLARLLRFSWALYINNLKFKHPTLVSKLKSLVKNLYGKKVEFNVVELKKMHLSSDIFTQVVALKLKNRNNKLYKVLRSSLSKVNIPNVSRISERFSYFDKDNYLPNKIRNTNVSAMFENEGLNNFNTVYNKTKDSLNNLLSGFFPSAEIMVDKVKSRTSENISPISINDYVLKNLKHLKLAGVRVEAKGRLTRRFKAQRSVFKMKYKGGLKNVDSSFKGLSAVMLRGIVKSNVQQSIISSKNRVGAYGIKGWVGNK